MSFVCSKKGITIIATSLIVVSVVVGLTLYFTLYNESDTIELSKNPLLATTIDHRIVLLDWSKKQYSTLVKEHSRVIRSFDYSIKHKILFYGVDYFGDPIKTWNDKYERSLNYTKHWIKSAMIVDDFNDKLYVLDKPNATLWVMDIKTDYHAAVLTRLDSPKDIALDAKRRLLYILERSKINVYAMDQGRIHKIRTESIEPANVFSIDQSTGKLYYASSTSIMSVDNNGTKSHVTYTDNVIDSLAFRKFGLFQVAYSKDGIFFRTLSVCQLYNEDKACINYEKINDDDDVTSQLLSIKSYSESFEEESETTPCDEDNGGCQHLCILYQLPYNYRCMCDDGLVLDKDKLSCHKFDLSNIITNY